MSDEKLFPPSIMDMKARAELHDVVAILTVDPKGYWTYQDIDADLLNSEEEADQKAAALTWVWAYRRAMGWVGISGRRV